MNICQFWLVRHMRVFFFILSTTTKKVWLWRITPFISLSRASVCLYPTILPLPPSPTCTSYPQLNTALGRIKINIWVVTIVTDLKIWAYGFPGQREAHEGQRCMDNASSSLSLLHGPTQSQRHHSQPAVWRGEDHPYRAVFMLQWAWD